jgi:DNA-binding LacI/PurR family transcriptional regulator
MLLDAGHRRIAYVTGRPQTEPPLDHYSVYDRRDGYRAAMAEAGLEPVQVDAPRGETSAQQIAQARDILTGPDRPTAIFIVRGDATVATWIGAAMSLGLQVPRDLSIVGLAEWNIDVLGHQVSSMKLPQREVGRGAVEMVLSKADRPQQPLESRVMPFRVNQGQTIHPPRPST